MEQYLTLRYYTMAAKPLQNHMDITDKHFKEMPIGGLDFNKPCISLLPFSSTRKGYLFQAGGI